MADSSVLNLMWKITELNFPYLTEVSVLFAIIITFINDHYLKYQYPGFMVGKLSDFAGIYYVPFFIYALFSFLRSPFKKHVFIQKNYFMICIVAVDVLFILLKTTEMRVIFMNFFSRHFFRIQIIDDPTDLVALVMNWSSYLTARKFFIRDHPQ